MEEPRRQFIPGLGILLLAAVLLGTVGALLHDFRGVGHGRVGALIWGGGVLVTFVLGTAYISRRLLPLQGNAGWGKGFELLWRSYLMGVNQVLSGVRHEPIGSPARRKQTKAAARSSSFAMLGAGFLFSHEAAAITRGNSFARADGPGLVFLQPGETIVKVFDLRTQSRKQEVEATTRDGIPVKTSVSVSFHVRRLSPDERRPRSEMEEIPYRYDRTALFDLTYAASVTGDNERLDWTEQVAPQAATLLVSEIGRYTLDQLLVSGGAEPIGEMKKSIQRGLEALQEAEDGPTLPKGITITGVGIGALEVDKDPLNDVRTKRLATWQVKLQSRAKQALAEGDIETQRLINQARTHVLSESIDNLLSSIETMQAHGQIQLHEAILSQLVATLESMAASQSFGGVPNQGHWLSLAADTSRELRDILEQEE